VSHELTRILESSRLDTRLLPAAERFTLWHASMAPLFALYPASDWRSDRLAASATVVHLGELLLAEVSVSASACAWEGRQGAVRATPELLMLQLQTAGEGIAISGQREHHIQPGTITLVDLTEPYLSEDRGFACLCLLIPRITLAARLRAPLPPGGLSLPPDRPLGQILAAHLQTLWKTLPSLSPHELPIVTVGLLAAIANAFTPVDPVALGASAMADASRTRMLALFHHLDRHLQTPLEIEQLCKRFGYSRSALYRLFKPYGGIAAYRRQRCLVGSFRELRSPLTVHRSIAEIAHRWGFSDQSHFSRAFRDAFGLSPSQVRARALTSDANHQRSGVSPLKLPTYHDWLQAF